MIFAIYIHHDEQKCQIYEDFLQISQKKKQPNEKKAEDGISLLARRDIHKDQ